MNSKYSFIVDVTDVPDIEETFSTYLQQRRKRWSGEVPLVDSAHIDVLSEWSDKLTRNKS